MKVQFSLPKDNDFFNRYATLIPTLSNLGALAQIISALTEIGIIYSLIYSRVIVFSPNLANLIAMIGAIIGTVFLELGLRKFAPYGVRAILFKRSAGLDLVMSIIILSTMLSFLIVSGSLSFRGSKELITILKPNPQLESTQSTEFKYNDQKEELRTLCSKDSISIATGYHKQIAAIQNEYSALIDEQESRLRQYQRKEQRTGLSYQTKREVIKSEIAAFKAAKSNQINQLEAAQADKLYLLSNHLRNDLKGLKSLYLIELRTINEINNKTLINAKSSTINYGNSLAWFTVFCIVFFLFTVVIDEVHKKGSGIEPIALPNQYFFSQSILADFSNMINEKLNFKARKMIHTLAENTPLPPQPIAPPILYDFEKIQQQRLMFYTNKIPPQELKFNYRLPTNVGNHLKTDADKIDITGKDLESKILDYIKAHNELEKQNLPEQAKEMQLRADDVISAYLGDGATKEEIEELRNVIIGYLEGKNDNPFRRNPIGFNKGETVEKVNTSNIHSNTVKMAIRQPYNATIDGQRTCLHCGTAYIYKQHTQKFCSEKCRISAWQLKTGKVLKKKKKY